MAAGTNVIAGAGTGYSLVRIPSKASIGTPFGESSHVSVRAGVNAGFVGFALVAADEQGRVLTEGGVASGVVGGRLPGSAKIDFVVPLGGAQYDFQKFYQDRFVFSPGLYRLYLISGPGRAAVTVKLDGLSGRTTLSPAADARAEIVRPPSTILPGTTSNLYSGGAHRSLDSAGLMLQALWLRTNPHAAGQFGFCYYGTAPPPDPVAYAPGCPAAETSLANDRNFMLEDDIKLFLEAIPLPGEGTYGQGFWYATQSVVTDTDNVALWLQFDRR
jgi:hypothetical protein